MLAPVAVLVAAALGPLNPVDTIARSKFVRAFQTRQGEAAATVCLPAERPDQLAAQVADLPRVLRALEAAGARAVVYDLPVLPTAEQGRTSLPVVVNAKGAPTYSGVQVTGDVGKEFSSGLPVLLGMTASEQALAVVALGIHRGEKSLSQGETVGAIGGAFVGDQQFPIYGTMLFMPYLIPFLHWDKVDTWEGVAGRTVFIGACRVDKELTRYGRQPGTVAHGELFETLRDGVIIRPLPVVFDGALALAVYGAARAARSLSRRWARLAAVGIGIPAVAAILAVSLHGVWLGLTGIFVATVLAAWERPGR